MLTASDASAARALAARLRYFDQTYQVGKHVVQLHFARHYNAIEQGKPTPDTELSTGCVVAMVIAAIVSGLWLLAASMAR